MHITIVDGPPWIGVSRWLKEMSANHGYDTTMIIPEFANVAMSNTKLQTSNLTWALAGSVQGLVKAINDAEKRWVNRLILWGSPVSYRSLARVRKWNHIDVDVLKQYEEIMRAAANHTDILLLKPSKGSGYNPNMVKIIPPNSIPQFVDTLSEEYEGLFSEVNIQNISLVRNSLTLQRH